MLPPHVWTVAVPETAGVHWKTRSGDVPELPQLPASELAPLVVPLKVPPAAGMTLGLLHAPPSGRVVVVEVVVDVVVVGGFAVVVVVEVVVVEVVVAGQAGVLTFTVPLLLDWFPALSTAETA